MLFPGRIYIARGPWHLKDFLQHLPAKYNRRPKNVLLSERKALALCHMANTALVIALRL